MVIGSPKVTKSIASRCLSLPPELLPMVIGSPKVIKSIASRCLPLPPELLPMLIGSPKVIKSIASRCLLSYLGVYAGIIFFICMYMCKCDCASA